jgi:ligand-binding SRPBCC domain-containing protein
MAVFERTFEVKAPLAEVAAFHDDAKSLAAITPPPIRVKIVRFDAPVRAGSKVIFRLMLGPLGVTWDGEIVAYEPQQFFRDIMHHGPFGQWSHTHSFTATAGGTQVSDRVEYEPPFGLPGKIIDPILVRPALKYLFFYRARQTRRLLEKPAANREIARGW